MPGGAEICRHLCRIGCRSGQCAYHNSYAVGFYSVRRDVISSQMSQPPLDLITGHGIPDSAADDKADARPIDVLLIQPYNMDDQRRTTCAESTPGRSPKVLRAAHSQ